MRPAWQRAEERTLTVLSLSPLYFRSETNSTSTLESQSVRCFVVGLRSRCSRCHGSRRRPLNLLGPARVRSHPGHPVHPVWPGQQLHLRLHQYGAFQRGALLAPAWRRSQRRRLPDRSHPGGRRPLAKPDQRQWQNFTTDGETKVFLITWKCRAQNR